MKTKDYIERMTPEGPLAISHDGPRLRAAVAVGSARSAGAPCNEARATSHHLGTQIARAVDEGWGTRC
jgi:hypothetical protein